MSSNRIEWVDWMKTIGIYFIVLGHFFSIGYKYIYVFNVPVFFFISGFLCKRETDLTKFWTKLLYNLIVPMLIISTINFLFECIFELNEGTFELKDIIYFIIYVILGFHKGVGVCWFVYTLIILKVIYQYCNKKPLFYTIGILALLMAYCYNHFDFSYYNSLLKESNSIVNVCTAFPFFALGVYFNNKKIHLNRLDGKLILFTIVLVCLLLVYVCGRNNDFVWMVICGYGGNFLWFITGGIAGICCIFAVSKLLGHTTKYSTIISKGTILILGFHMHFISLLRCYFKNTIADFGFAAIIVFLFVPLILGAEKYFPLILGKYRINNSKSMNS